jgi:hypothetical protein
MAALLSRVLYLAPAALLYFATSVPAFADSTVRIVRLSYIDGKVGIDRGANRGYEKAMINLPITQGTRLATGEDGRAEVEFEDGTTMRLAPGSEAAFPQLSLRDSGAKESEIEVSRGTVYVDYSGSKDSEFTMQFGKERIALTRGAHLRLSVGTKNAALAVFKGDIAVNGPSGSIEVKKKQTAKFDLADQAAPEVAKNVEPQRFDSWDSDADQYRERYAAKSQASYSPYAYGTYDLAYYGNFSTVAGYGTMWQPYFAGAGWDPFMDGAWAFYPGWGFGWVSAYPWGWVPYHYGTWMFVPGYGWMWQPGGVWTAWYSVPRIANPPAGYSAPRPPASGTATVLVSRGPHSEIASNGKLVLRGNSAGLGIPRGEIEGLHGLSEKAQKHGSVTRPIETVSPRMSSGRSAGSTGFSQPPARTSTSTVSHSAPSSAGASAPHR